MLEELSEEKLKELKLKANEARQLVLETLLEAKSGHSGGPLGMADIFTALYFHIMKIDPQNPTWEDRDRLLLSNGHICPIQYVIMALRGYFPVEELKTLRKINSRLQGHPHRTILPGIENTSGPLGEGISQAIGVALAAKLDKKDYKIYVLTSDGEQDEGNTWEAAMFAGKMKLTNMIQIMDRNKIQLDGPTEEIMPLDSMKAKYESFNWNAIEIDGHNMQELIKAINKAQEVTDKPTVIIANTVLGKGVSYMENNYKWHGNPPDLADVPGAPVKGEQTKVALEELRAIREKIEQGAY
jgi:transketolase